MGRTKIPSTVKTVNNRPSPLLHVQTSVLHSMRATPAPVTPDQMTDALLAAWWMSRWESASDTLLRRVASRACDDGGIRSSTTGDPAGHSALLPTALFVAAGSARSLVRPALLLDAVDVPGGGTCRFEDALARAAERLVAAAAEPMLAPLDEMSAAMKSRYVTLGSGMQEVVEIPALIAAGLAGAADVVTMLHGVGPDWSGPSMLALHEAGNAARTAAWSLTHSSCSGIGANAVVGLSAGTIMAVAVGALGGAGTAEIVAELASQVGPGGFPTAPGAPEAWVHETWLASHVFDRYGLDNAATRCRTAVSLACQRHFPAWVAAFDPKVAPPGNGALCMAAVFASKRAASPPHERERQLA